MPAKPSKKSGTIVFKTNTTIGAVDAIEDRTNLERCFFDRGDIDALRDTSNPLSIILGRTGAGKSALLRMLSLDQDHTTLLDPDQLALTYLTNSSALRAYESFGVRCSAAVKLEGIRPEIR